MSKLSGRWNTNGVLSAASLAIRVSGVRCSWSVVSSPWFVVGLARGSGRRRPPDRSLSPGLGSSQDHATAPGVSPFRAVPQSSSQPRRFVFIPGSSDLPSPQLFSVSFRSFRGQISPISADPPGNLLQTGRMSGPVLIENRFCSAPACRQVRPRPTNWRKSLLERMDGELQNRRTRWSGLDLRSVILADPRNQQN